MKKILFIAVALVITTIAIAKPKKSKKNENSVKLEDVSSSLAEFQDNETYNFIGDSIAFEKPGKEKYDNIFKESAVVYATIVQVQRTLKAINAEEVKLMSDFAVASVKFAVLDLPKMNEKVEKLQADIKLLNPKEDFKGKDVRKAPKAANGIKQAGEQLASALKLLPDVLSELNTIAEKMKK